MSVICQTFVQNAWRSDLCSNCFKCLADHSDTRNRSACDRMSTPRYMPQATSLYQSRGISTTLKWRLSEPIYERVARRDFGSQTPSKANQETTEPETRNQHYSEYNNRGILVKKPTPEKKLRSRPTVDFASEEALVIGYGGNDYDSDQSPWEMASDDGSIDLDLLDDTDEDRKISKLTKNNTEFNSSNKNLLIEDKELDKINCIINNNNANNNKTSTQQKVLTCVTYNDIQPQKTEKKLNQYYFSSNIEPLKSYLHHSNVNEQSKTNLDAVKIDNTKRNPNNENCRNLLNDDFTPLNTRTYSFVSEVNRNAAGSEHGSDSDYSTCRLTAGDSTDSESFQDAEEPRIIPCPSFLHGNYPRTLQQQPSTSSLDSEKKYDGGSSTSGDISNLSEDSDTIESNERTYKSRISRSAKILSTSSDNRVVTHVTRDKKSPPVPTTTQPIQNESLGKPEVTVDTVSSAKAPDSPSTKKVSVEEVPQQPDGPHFGKNECKPTINKTEAVYVSINAQPNPKLQTDLNSNTNCTETSPNPNPPVEINLRNIIAVNGCETSSKEASETDRQPTADETKTSSPNTVVVKTDNSQKHARKQAPIKETGGGFTPTETEESQTATPKPQKDSSVDKSPSDDDEGSPEAINNRQSKLAALALELELARRDSEINSSKVPPPPSLPAVPPEVRAKCSPRTIVATPPNPGENYPTIKKGGGISCTSRLITLPDVLQETSTPTKLKKNRFSLKKLLKRNKDSGTFTPTSKEANPKAWKKQTFDRNRLSLEIVHPMDLTSDPPTSGDSTPTEDGQYTVSKHPGRGVFKGGYSRARSLSALPQWAGDYQDPSDCSLLGCRKVDTMPARKAGTVAERKKIRPSLVRTPSCSALPNRPTVTIAVQDRAPPPKPPPPPKYKVMQPPPPPPPHQPRISKPPSCSPARPPPPKIPETKSRIQSADSSRPVVRDSSNLDKEYANLGDIRSLLTPKKPQRPSAVSAPRDGETDCKTDDAYETLQAAEEEDHYTYLDETEIKLQKSQETATKEPTPSLKANGDRSACGRPWLDLQTSYAAIAAANYESLAEIITASVNEGGEFFQSGGKSLKWKDFSVDGGDPQRLASSRSVYSGSYKPHKGNKIQLMVTPKMQSTPPNTRNQVRYPVLASFNDYTPTCHTPGSSAPPEEWASVYVLQQSHIFSVSQFARSNSSDQTDQHIHLRNYCFVLLQLIHTLKSLQAEGIEDINYDLEQLVLVATSEDKPPIFVLFPEDKTYLTLGDSGHTRKTLCQATLLTMYHFLRIDHAEDLDSCLVNGERLSEPVAHTFRAIAEVLLEEKASSLSQAKGFLEYMLWGPVDVRISEATDVLDVVLQRWLDLQRAQMVKSTISQMQQKAHLHVYEEYQLVFLLQASVKSLKSVISKL